jgi:hypothetical protein
MVLFHEIAFSLKMMGLYAHDHNNMSRALSKKHYAHPILH